MPVFFEVSVKIRTPRGKTIELAPKAELIWPVLEDGTKYIMEQGKLSPLYKTAQRLGFRYSREPFIAAGQRRDYYNTPDEVIAEGTGDCEDFAMWRAAWLRQNGEPEARVGLLEFRRPDGSPSGWHAIVIRPGRMKKGPNTYGAPGKAYAGMRVKLYGGNDLGWGPDMHNWWVEDPSYALGMPDPARNIGTSGIGSGRKPASSPTTEGWLPWALAAFGGVLALRAGSSDTPEPEIDEPGIQLSTPEMRRVLSQSGWPVNLHDEAIRVIRSESGGWTHARQRNTMRDGRKNVDRGLWQFSSIYHPEVSDEMADDPLTASEEALRVYLDRGWREWLGARRIGMAGAEPDSEPDTGTVLFVDSDPGRLADLSDQQLIDEIEGYQGSEIASRIARGVRSGRITREELLDIHEAAVDAYETAQRGIALKASWPVAAVTQTASDIVHTAADVHETITSAFPWVMVGGIALCVFLATRPKGRVIA